MILFTLLVSALAVPSAHAGEPYLRPLKLLSERRAHNAGALDPAEHLSIGEFRLYKKDGVLPGRVDPTLVYVRKVHAVQSAVDRLKDSVAALQYLARGNSMSALHAVVRPHMEVAEVLASIHETMRYVGARQVNADLRPLMAAARDAAKVASETKTYEVTGGAYGGDVAGLLANAKSASTTAISALNLIGTDHEALKRMTR